jgi:ABC-2 type transport system permease protein
MSINRILAITGRIISQFRRDHRTLGLIFIAPILVMTIFGYVFRAQEGDTIRVAVVNEDRSPDGQASLTVPLIDSLNANKERLKVIEMSRADAGVAVEKGDQDVALVFGPTFTADMQTKRKTGVEVIVEGSNPAQASSALSVVGQALSSAAPRLLFSTLPPGTLPGVMPLGPPLEITTTRLYGDSNLQPLDYFAPMFIAYIAFFLIFLLTSVSFLRERTQGTMERLSASPVTRLELVLGYMLGFGFFALLQATVLVLFTVYALNIHYTGNLLPIFVVTIALVLGAVNLGIFLSTFARNELQAIQFIPIVILPQVLLSGLLWPVSEMPGWLQAIARAMPLTYAIEALTDLMLRGKDLFATWIAIVVLFGFAALAALLAASTVRREVA